jgi:hypothetical protein
VSISLLTNDKLNFSLFSLPLCLSTSPLTKGRKPNGTAAAYSMHLLCLFKTKGMEQVQIHLSDFQNFNFFFCFSKEVCNFLTLCPSEPDISLTEGEFANLFRLWFKFGLFRSEGVFSSSILLLLFRRSLV